jgi:hypothetical protein
MLQKEKNNENRCIANHFDVCGCCMVYLPGIASLARPLRALKWSTNLSHAIIAVQPTQV